MAFPASDAFAKLGGVLLLLIGGMKVTQDHAGGLLPTPNSTNNELLTSGGLDQVMTTSLRRFPVRGKPGRAIFWIEMISITSRQQATKA